MLPIIADGTQPPSRGNSMDWDEPFFLGGIAAAMVLIILVVGLIWVVRRQKPAVAVQPGTYPPGFQQFPPQGPPPGR
jgi:hypothetical protein